MQKNNYLTNYLKTKLATKKSVLMTHAVLGYPTHQDSQRIVTTMAGAGADLIELQIPFSDPVADGPVIMAANEVAIEQNMDVNRSFELIAELKNRTEVPLLIMCYFHSIFQFGLKKFCERAAEVGVLGMIVPDLPPEEDAREGFTKTCQQLGIDVIKVVSPEMSKERLKVVLKDSSGFVYCTARVGITGSDTYFKKELFAFTTLVKKISSLPVAIGFGIKTNEQVRDVADQDCVSVIGSAVLEKYNTDGLEAVETYIKDIKK